MRVTVRLFAILRDRAGVDHLILDLEDGATVASAVERAAERLPPIRPLMPRVAFALNQQYVKSDAVLNEGDELALIPPVSGGMR